MAIRQSHPTGQELLMALDEELTPAQQAEVDGHVAACVTCRQRRASIEAALAETAMLALEDDASTGPALRARLAEALARRSQARPPLWESPVRVAPGLSYRHLLLGGAAALLMVSIVGLSRLMSTTPTDAIVDRLALPQAGLTPGAVSPMTSQELCNGSLPSRRVSSDVRHQVLRAYGMEHIPESEYELDALITPELGGSTDTTNLWPQRYASPIWNARVKDELERLLPTLVCSGRVDLATAQRDIATNWVAAYQRYFNTSRPLQAHLDPSMDDEDELVFEEPIAVAAVGLTR